MFLVLMNSKLLNNNIRDIHKIINDKIVSINNSLVKREREMDYGDIIYLLYKKNYSGDSYDNIISEMKIEGKSNVTKAAFIKKRKLLDCKYLNELNDDLLHYIYVKNTGRILAVDGSHVNMHKKLTKFGFPLSANGHYATGLISCIYDVKNKIPINCNLVTGTDERKAFLEQLPYLKKGDTVITDRGYYSYDLAQKLTENGINYIFRMKKDTKMVRELNSTKMNEMNVSIKKCRGKNTPVSARKNYEIDQEYITSNRNSPKNGKYYMCTKKFNQHIN